MFIKIVRNGHESLYPAESGPFDYGTRYLYEDPKDPKSSDGWLEELRVKVGVPRIRFLLENEESTPTGYRNFIDPENHPEDHGKPWWMVYWIAYEESIPRGNDTENVRTVLVTLGEIYILSDNGKTIDRVKA